VRSDARWHHQSGQDARFVAFLSVCVGWRFSKGFFIPFRRLLLLLLDWAGSWERNGSLDVHLFQLLAFCEPLQGKPRDGRDVYVREPLGPQQLPHRASQILRPRRKRQSNTHKVHQQNRHLVLHPRKNVCHDGSVGLHPVRLVAFFQKRDRHLETEDVGLYMKTGFQ